MKYFSVSRLRGNDKCHVGYDMYTYRVQHTSVYKIMLFNETYLVSIRIIRDFYRMCNTLCMLSVANDFYGYAGEGNATF